MRKLMIGIWIVCLAAAAQARTKPSRMIPAQLGQARYVALGYDLGGRFFSDNTISQEQFRIPPQDREALQRVRSALEKWKHYVITINPNEADLLIEVRTGRIATLGAGLAAGSVSGPVYGAEVSSPDDMLEVYQAMGGKEGALLWRRLQKDGLSGSPPPLFKQFRRDVDSIPAHH